MSEESKKPQAFGPVPKYRPHFAAWAATEPTPSVEKPVVGESDTLASPLGSASTIDAADASALRNGRREWSTPALSTTPFVRNPVPGELAAPPEARVDEGVTGESATSELPLEPFLDEAAPVEAATSELPLEPFVDEPVAEESAASVLLIEPFIDEPMPAEAATSELPLEPFVDEPVAEESATSVLLIEPFIDEPMVAEPTSSELALEPFIEEVVVAESPTLAASPEPPIEESADAEPARSESPLEPFFEEHIVEKAATVALPPENISPIDDADAPPLDNGRRIWATPVLSTTPFVPHPVRQPNAAPPWSRDQLMIAAAALGALLTIVVTRPWEYVENLQPPPANLATQSLTKPGVLPSPIPPVAKPATKAAPVPAALAEAAPMKPAAMLPETAPKQPFTAFSAPALPQTMPPFKVATAPANNPAVKPEPAEPAATESLSDDAGEPPHSNRTHTDFALVQGELMEASIRSQLARMGYASLGVAVSDEGDVYLEGTFLNQADQDRVIAMIRRYRHVRDISFSGTVWHGEQAHASRDAAEVKTSDRAAPPPTTAWHAAPSLLAPLPKVAPSAEFPITAADEPVPGGRNDAPASPLPTPSHDQSIWPVQ